MMERLTSTPFNPEPRPLKEARELRVSGKGFSSTVPTLVDRCGGPGDFEHERLVQENRYFHLFVKYAKSDPNEILKKITSSQQQCMAGR